MVDNYEKQEIYRFMKINLKKSLTAGFYYQAIFIEYAIAEDRCLSLLRHGGVKYLDNRGYEIKLSSKINKLRSNSVFSDSYVRKRLTLELLQRLEDWKRERDKLIHDLANVSYDDERIKTIAIEGQDIVRILDNKTKSINKYFDSNIK